MAGTTGSAVVGFPGCRRSGFGEMMTGPGGPGLGSAVTGAAVTIATNPAMIAVPRTAPGTITTSNLPEATYRCPNRQPRSPRTAVRSQSDQTELCGFGHEAVPWQHPDGVTHRPGPRQLVDTVKICTAPPPNPCAPCRWSGSRRVSPDSTRPSTTLRPPPLGPKPVENDGCGERSVRCPAGDVGQTDAVDVDDGDAGQASVTRCR